MEHRQRSSFVYKMFGSSKAGSKRAYKDGVKHGKGAWEAAKDTGHAVGDVIKTVVRASPYLGLLGGGAYLGYKVSEKAKKQK